MSAGAALPAVASACGRGCVRGLRERDGCSAGPDAGRGGDGGFHSTGVEVYGRNKPGAGVNYQGQLAYLPLVGGWAQRGRLLGSELLAGNDSTRGEEPRGLLRRVLGYLPASHGAVSARFDSGFYRVDLLSDRRARSVRFSISVPRSSAMWSALIYGYSFILTDLAGDAATVEHHHRDRPRAHVFF